MANRTALQRAAQENLAGKRKRKLPWEKRGLSRLERVIAFLEFLPVTKGILRGKTLRLLPNQLRFIERVYGDDNVRLAVRSEPRGNGKTGLVSGLGLVHLLGPEAEPRGECYSAAVNRLQSSLMHEEMAAIIEAVPEFAARVQIRRGGAAALHRGGGRSRCGFEIRSIVSRCAARPWLSTILVGL